MGWASAIRDDTGVERALSDTTQGWSERYLRISTQRGASAALDITHWFKIILRFIFNFTLECWVFSSHILTKKLKWFRSAWQWSLSGRFWRQTQEIRQRSWSCQTRWLHHKPSWLPASEHSSLHGAWRLPSWSSCVSAWNHLGCQW